METRSSKTVDVVTYNVLSPNLCSKKIFPECSEDAVNPQQRLDRVKAKLTACMLSESIICLQEVCLEWSDDLRVFFESNKYCYIDSISGDRRHKCMGLAIAFPRSNFQLSSMATIVPGSMIGDDSTMASRATRRRPLVGIDVLVLTMVFLITVVAIQCTVGLGNTGHICVSIFACFLLTVFVWRKITHLAFLFGVATVLYTGGFGTTVHICVSTLACACIAAVLWGGALHIEIIRGQNTVATAIGKRNRAISIRLRPLARGLSSPEREFTITNYHMPCEFKHPSIMYLHLVALLKHFHTFRNGGRAILAGDFNIQHGSQLYRYAVSGRDESGELQTLLKKDDWSEPVVEFTPLFDLFDGVSGKDLKFTCRATTSWNGEFSGILDYIFATNDFRCSSVDYDDRIQNAPPTSLPTADEPSDHIPIRATLRL